MNVNGINAGAVNWEALLSSLGDVEKTGNVDGKSLFTITTRVGDEEKTMTVGIPDDLDIPEEVDQGTLEALVDKLAATGLGFTDEQVSKMKDSISGLLKQSAGAINEVNAKSKGNVMFDLYALMSLMIDVAQSQRDAAREMRTAQNQAIQKAIQNQADMQHDAAMVGMIVGIVCGAVSALVSIGTMVGQGVAASKQSQIMSQSGADSAQMHSSALQNTDNVATAQAKLDATAQKVGDEVATRVNNDFDAQIVDDQAGNLKTNLDNAGNRVASAQQNLDAKNVELQGAQAELDQKTQAKNDAQANLDARKAQVNASREKQQYIREQMSSGAPADPARLAEFDARIGDIDQARAEIPQLEAALNTANQELTTAQNNVQLKQGAVDLANTELTSAKGAQTQAKADYVKTVQDVAAQYEEKYQTAVDRLNNPPDGADKAQLKADVEAARTDMEMAFAKEAQLLSQDGVMTPSEQKTLVASARARVDVTMERVTQRADFKTAERRMSTLMGINNINQSIGGVAQSAVQNYSAMLTAEATRKGAEKQQEEEMLDQTKDLFSQEQKLIDQVIQLFSAVIQAESQSMRDAIQA